ncbi:phage antirepressor [Arthrobacter sp. NPDC056493]|uniref:phage antirepressor n=1 Tax=Arthrobacter sp. NPDC056493 TaxID=3345839 RepID=UPI00366BAA2D
MSALQQFVYAGHDVRTLEMDGEPWFVLADLCTVLGLRNATMISQRIDADALSQAEVIDSMGRKQTASIVNEAGMYEVVIRSDKPEAVKFRRWITGEVLPVLRRTGTYTAGPAYELPQSFADALRQLADTHEQLEAATPKVEAYEALMATDGLYSMQASAKSLGYGPNILYRELRRLGILQGNNLPYQKYAHHFEVKLGSYRNRKNELVPTATTMVRPAGLDFLRRKLARAAEAAGELARPSVSAR